MHFSHFSLWSLSLFDFEGDKSTPNINVNFFFQTFVALIRCKGGGGGGGGESKDFAGKGGDECLNFLYLKKYST